MTSVEANYVRQFVDQIANEAARGVMLAVEEDQLTDVIAKNQCSIQIDGDGRWQSMAIFYPGEKCTEIGTVVTMPSYRGQGLATKVTINAVLSAQLHYPHLPIIALTNAASTSLFHKLGFREQPKAHGFAELWQPCAERCKEWCNWPCCHCHYMVLSGTLYAKNSRTYSVITPSPDDLLPASELYATVWKEPPWCEYDWQVDAVYEYLSDVPNKQDGKVLIATSGNNVIGFTAGWQAGESSRNKLGGMLDASLPAFYIAELGCDSNYRGCGVGLSLSQALLAQAQAAGYQQFFLRTHLHAEPARRLYRSLGFQETGVLDRDHPDRGYWLLQP